MKNKNCSRSALTFQQSVYQTIHIEFEILFAHFGCSVFRLPIATAMRCWLFLYHVKRVNRGKSKDAILVQFRSAQEEVDCQWMQSRSLVAMNCATSDKLPFHFTRFSVWIFHTSTNDLRTNDRKEDPNDLWAFVKMCMILLFGEWFSTSFFETIFARVADLSQKLWFTSTRTHSHTQLK